MKQLVNDCLEFLFRTVGGVFVLCLLMVLIFMAIFWPRSERDEPLPWLGIVGSNVNGKIVRQYGLPFTRGVLVERVLSNSPADYANVAPGDFVVKFNNQLVMSQTHLQTLLYTMEPEERVAITVYRNGAYYNLLLLLAMRPMENWLPGEAAALAPAAQMPWGTGAAIAQQTSTLAPPLTPAASLPHPFRGVCSNCHVIVSNLQANQPDAQLVAALAPQQALPVPQTPLDTIPAPPTEEFVWAGIDVQPLGPAVSRTLGLPPNTTGVVADEVLPGSRGDRGGVREGDLIREINGFPISDVNAFATILKAQRLIGGVLLVQRAGGQMLYVTVSEV